MWQAIQYVGTPLALIAFLAAVVAYIYNARITNLRNSIGSARDDGRADLVEGLLRDFKVVDTKNLTKTQRYNITLKLIDERRQKLKIFSISSITAFVLLCSFMTVVHLFGRIESNKIADSNSKGDVGENSTGTAGASHAPVNVTYDTIETYQGLKIQKPSSWFLVNDGESPTFSVENPTDKSVYITISPMERDNYLTIEGISCQFERNIITGGAGPESDDVAILDKCILLDEGKRFEELVLFIHGNLNYALRCGYEEGKANLYREICNTVVGTARYRLES